VRASGAEIGGDLRFDRAGIGMPAGQVYAVVADGAVVRGQITATDAHVHGEICLQDARIQHNVQLQRSIVRAPGANAVNLNRATIGGTVDCGLMRAEGSLRLSDITAGSVFVSGATLSAPCVVDQMIYQVGAREIPFDPLLNLIGAQITGTVRGNPSGRPFRARGSIALRGARVSRSVQFISAQIACDDGPAIDASTLTCSDLFLAGIDTVGGVRFTDARISGDVDLTRAHLRWDPESVTDLAAGRLPLPSIDGGAAEIGGDAWFDGTMAEGLVRLRRTTVRRSVGMKDVVYGAAAVRDASVAAGAEVTPMPEVAGDSTLLALDLAMLQTPDLVVAPAQPIRGNVDLSRAVILSFTDNGNLWHAERLDLLGLRYQVHIDLDAKPGEEDWATQIRRFESTKILPPPSAMQTDVALPTGQLSQPYLQLAAIYRATGSDSIARRILFEMRKREWAQRTASSRGVRGLWVAFASLLYRITVGYGYRLQLALYWLVGLWLAGFLVFAFLAPARAPEPVAVVENGRTQVCIVLPDADPVADQPGYCGNFSPALYSLDLLIPVVDLGQKSSWHYRNEGIQLFSDFLQVAGWILATAAATAALGLVGRADQER
jgi:hypothetical protein